MRRKPACRYGELRGTDGSLRRGVRRAAGCDDTLFGRSPYLYIPYINMNAGMAAGYFFKKFYADNLIVPAAAAAAAGFMKDLILAFLVFAGGARFGFAGILIRYIVPSALMTGLFCTLVHPVLKPALLTQVKRRQADRLSR